MSHNRELIFEWTLIGLLLILGGLLFVQAVPFLNGTLGAITLYILLRRSNVYLANRFSPTFAPWILTLAVTVFVVIPFSAGIWYLIDLINNLDFDINVVIKRFSDTIKYIENTTKLDLVSEKSIAFATAKVTSFMNSLVAGINDAAINLFTAILLLFFLLAGGIRMERAIARCLPFNDRNKTTVINKVSTIVKSNAIGIPLLAMIQGTVAAFGYYICGVNNPVEFGVLTGFASMIPIVGSMLVWIPLAIVQYFEQGTMSAVYVTLYGIVVISQSDNVLRMIVQKRMADTHPLVTIFGVIAGLPLFGFMGLIFGPLLVAMFLLFLEMFVKQYITCEYAHDSDPDPNGPSGNGRSNALRNGRTSERDARNSDRNGRGNDRNSDRDSRNLDRDGRNADRNTRSADSSEQNNRNSRNAGRGDNGLNSRNDSYANSRSDVGSNGHREDKWALKNANPRAKDNSINGTAMSKAESSRLAGRKPSDDDGVERLLNRAKDREQKANKRTATPVPDTLPSAVRQGSDKNQEHKKQAAASTDSKGTKDKSQSRTDAKADSSYKLASSAKSDSTAKPDGTSKPARSTSTNSGASNGSASANTTTAGAASAVASEGKSSRVANSSIGTGEASRKSDFKSAKADAKQQKREAAKLRVTEEQKANERELARETLSVDGKRTAVNLAHKYEDKDSTAGRSLVARAISDAIGSFERFDDLDNQMHNAPGSDMFKDDYLTEQTKEAIASSRAKRKQQSDAASYADGSDSALSPIKHRSTSDASDTADLHNASAKRDSADNVSSQKSSNAQPDPWGQNAMDSSSASQSNSAERGDNNERKNRREHNGKSDGANESSANKSSNSNASGPSKSNNSNASGSSKSSNSNTSGSNKSSKASSEHNQHEDGRKHGDRQSRRQRNKDEHGSSESANHKRNQGQGKDNSKRNQNNANDNKSGRKTKTGRNERNSRSDNNSSRSRRDRRNSRIDDYYSRSDRRHSDYDMPMFETVVSHNYGARDTSRRPQLRTQLVSMYTAKGTVKAEPRRRPSKKRPHHR